MRGAQGYSPFGFHNHILGCVVGIRMARTIASKMKRPSSAKCLWRLNQGRFIGLARHSAFTLALSTSVSSFMWPLAVSCRWTPDEWISHCGHLTPPACARAAAGCTLPPLFASDLLKDILSSGKFPELNGDTRRSRLPSNFRSEALIYSLVDCIVKSVHLLCCSRLENRCAVSEAA